MTYTGHLERAHLRLLSAIDRHGSLTAAAKSLGLTQSALSHSIKRIEHQFGVKLWKKSGRNVAMTSAGQLLLEFGNRVLPQFDEIEHTLSQIAQGKLGTLRLGVECHPCYRWLLGVVKPYLHAFPEVDLDVKQRFQFGGVGALFGHEIDVLVTPDPLLRRGLVFVPVFEYEQVLVVGPSHRLATKSFVTPRDLEKETVVSYPVELERLDLYSQFLVPAGITPRRHKEIETTEIILQMVSCERGVAALPDWLVQEYRDELSLVPVRLGELGLNKKLYLGVRCDNLEKEYVHRFVQMARERGNSLSERASQP